ncbi:MAG: 1-(5-phosphoribosyl)-5-[(5-phosphoribosylamino)methylideneamino]imidazole-4-carboxamide isomerase [Pseudomonadota bacterium]|nr:1-(5-phosphoribosyl)-5-[(5-phosphoribosylamino)methylideneamino]imidazole-4-carboxamide isomerase [Pseudomonadota bacterium]
MIIYPAIDLKNGKCVRLLRGEMEAATVFSENPVAQVENFSEQGFTWLHIVDLNGAFEGRAFHRHLIESMVRATDLKVQLGGGIRSLETIEAWIRVGVARVILGTAALHDPNLVKEACKNFPGKVVVGIDGRNGRVAVNGWAEQSETPILELGRRFEDEGVSAIIYTDIDRDGAMSGINLETTSAFAATLSIPVIASGGVASMADLRALKNLEGRNVEGVIIGRALYQGGIDPRAALALMAKIC